MKDFSYIACRRNRGTMGAVLAVKKEIPAKILNVSSTGYSVAGCGTSVAAFTNCTLIVTFHPLTTGTFKGSLTVKDNAGDSPQTVSLSGGAQ